MALGTLTKVDSWVEGNKRIKVYDVQVTSGANYTAGGETIAPSSVGLRKIIAANVLGPAASSTPTSFQVGYNHSTNKLIAYGQNATPGPAVTQPEVTANTNLSTFTVRIQFVGY
jgi:hypothetical protein